MKRSKPLRTPKDDRKEQIAVIQQLAWNQEKVRLSKKEAAKLLTNERSTKG